MTTIELDDSLVNKVLKVGHYDNVQKAINTILSDYIKVHQTKKTPFDKLCFELNMSDEEVDTLFKRDKDIGRTIDL